MKYSEFDDYMRKCYGYPERIIGFTCKHENLGVRYEKFLDENDKISIKYNKNSSKDIVQRFGKDFKDAFLHLDNVILSECGQRCKKLCIMKR